jgi:beta-glucanase (GH16 family)
VKSQGAQTWAGTTFLTLDATEGELVTADHPLVTMRVWSPDAGTTVMLKLENSANGQQFYESSAVTAAAGTWQTLSFDFSNANHSLTFDRASVFFDFGTEGSGKTFYFDNVSFLNGANALATPTTLVFSDEFGGAVHDGTSAAASPTAHWTRETGTGNNGWGNGESQTYTNSLSNAFVEDGTLHIVASKTGTSITSARLKSDLPDLQPYGYMEVRAKLPSELGAWPAIWLLGNGTWPDTGEIDVVEWASMFSSNQAQAALHFKGDNNQTTTTYGNTSYKASTTLSSLIDEFHTYQLWWTPEAIRIGVDGDVNKAHFEYMKPAGATASWWPFDNPMNIILNLAIGGTMGGAVPNTDFSYTMEVDYVRVYQQVESFNAGSVLSALQNANNPSLLQSVSTARLARTGIDLSQVREAVTAGSIDDVTGVDTLFNAADTGVMDRLADAGMDLIDLGETLVDALAGADIDLDTAFSTGTLQVIASADPGSNTAWIQASLMNLVEVGVDRVLLPSATQGAVLALQDASDTAASVDLTGMPFFVHRADQPVALVLDDDDVTALLANPTSLQTLAAQGITELRPDLSVTTENLTTLAQGGTAGGLIVASPSNASPQEALWLALHPSPTDPFGPFTLPT